MPVLLQIWIVIVTLGLLAIALVTLRMMTRMFDKAAADISTLTVSVRESVTEINLVTRDARALVASVQDCVPPVRRVVDRLETVGQRTADLSSTLLDELEIPVFTAAAAAHGVRTGANHFMQRLMHDSSLATPPSMEITTMNDTTEPRGTSNVNSTLIAFAAGAVVGAGLALLLAPDSGKKTRERLASTARRWSTNAGEAIGHARDTVTDLGIDAKSAMKAGQDAFLADRAARDKRSERRMAQGAEGGTGLGSLDHAEEEVAR